MFWSEFWLVLCSGWSLMVVVAAVSDIMNGYLRRVDIELKYRRSWVGIVLAFMLFPWLFVEGSSIYFW